MNKTYPQAILLHAGQNALGIDGAEGLEPTLVRREGLKSLGKKAALGALAVVTAFTLTEMMMHSIENANTSNASVVSGGAPTTPDFGNPNVQTVLPPAQHSVK